MSASSADLAGMRVLERGWLSSNNVLIEDAGQAVLVDSSHVLHATQTVSLVQRALGERRLSRIVNTHLHSDHCGGNASLQRAFGCPITIPPGLWTAVQRWDEVALSYAPTGQRCERFKADDVLRPGQTLTVGSQRWSALAAPGHDPHSLILFNTHQGVLISADALWEKGLGVIFPELDGEDAFNDAAAVLDVIEALQPRWVIPGHGAPFTDVAGALVRARERLAGFSADPPRHLRHAMKVLLKYHLLEEQQQTWPELVRWLDGASLFHTVWQRLNRPAGSLDAFARQMVGELAASQVLAVRDGVIFNV